MGGVDYIGGVAWGCMAWMGGVRGGWLGDVWGGWEVCEEVGMRVGLGLFIALYSNAQS